MGHAGGVKRLDVEQRVGLRAIVAAQDNVRAVGQAGTRPRHELLESITAARTLGKDVLRAEEGVKADGPRVDGRVVARARQAYPMSARAEVAVERPDLTRGRV